MDQQTLMQRMIQAGVNIHNPQEVFDFFHNSLNDYISTGQKGVPEGVATLDSEGKVPLSQLPAFPDQDTTYTAATATEDGLMSKEDKIKLDSLQQVHILQLTQAAYDALTPEQKNQENTIYAIVG